MSSFPFRWGALARSTRARMRHDGIVESTIRLAVRTLQGLAVTAGWRLDDWLYPDWPETAFDGPIFIVGHWRTGTTFLHRALVDDTLRDGVAMNFAETHFPPLTLRRLAGAVSRAPGLRRESVRAWFRQIDDERFEQVDFLHRTRLREVAEDSHLLKTMFASIMWMEGGPWTFEAPEFRPLLRPETRSTDEQRRTLEAYRDCLTKNAYLAEAASPTVVGKNPEFSKRIGLVREVFPEARFIYLPRNPLESLPSLLELIERIWVFTSDAELDDGEHGKLLEPSHARHMLEDSIRLHRRVDEAMAEVPEGQKYVARFDDFFADPVEGIAEIVDQFELEGRRDDFRQRVADRSDRVRDESERDRATPGDFGLETSEITEPLADYFDRWDFSR